MSTEDTRLRQNEMSGLGLSCAQMRFNAPETVLLETSLTKGEGLLSSDGALVVQTGKFTGRSPKDKHIVRRASSEAEIWWDGNTPMSPEAFATLKADMFDYLGGSSVEVQDLICGSDPQNAVNIRLIAEYSWHALFLRHLLITPDASQLENYVADFTIINAPGFKADPARHGTQSDTVIALDFEERLVLIGGTEYAGENKKSAFTILNHLYPARGILPMHCSANHAKGDVEDSAIFFGLSGTGKTTLSSDPSRVLIGDDEHGWSDSGVFNFEGGCYAKTIRLSQGAEPDIWNAAHSYSTVLENVVMDTATRALDLDDAALTENTRAAYPLEFIPNASPHRRGGVPKHVILLTCDAFGVTPPIARLTPEQARSFFLLGFTSKVAGTERGVTGSQPTFSTCFGAPFLTRDPEVYAEMFEERLAASGAQCWLLNTGWTGGDATSGHRMPISVTRTVLSSAISGALDGTDFRKDTLWGIDVPVAVPGVDADLLDPLRTWADREGFKQSAKTLRSLIDAEAQRIGLPSMNWGVELEVVS